MTKHNMKIVTEPEPSVPCILLLENSNTSAKELEKTIAEGRFAFGRVAKDQSAPPPHRLEQARIKHDILQMSFESAPERVRIDIPRNQLDEFLRCVFIEEAINVIGKMGIVTLLAYGIETAFDLSKEASLNTEGPGLDQKQWRILLAWKQDLVRQYRSEPWKIVTPLALGWKHRLWCIIPKSQKIHPTLKSKLGRSEADKRDLKIRVIVPGWDVS